MVDDLKMVGYFTNRSRTPEGFLESTVELGAMKERELVEPC